ECSVGPRRGQGRLFDVRDTHDIAPVADRKAHVPAIVRAIGFHPAAVGSRRSLERDLPLVLDLNAGLGALRVDAVDSVRTPYDEPDRGVVRVLAFRVDDVLRVLGAG